MLLLLLPLLLLLLEPRSFLRVDILDRHLRSDGSLPGLLIVLPIGTSLFGELVLGLLVFRWGLLLVLVSRLLRSLISRLG